MMIFEELLRDIPFEPGTVVYVEQPEVFGITQYVTIVTPLASNSYSVIDRNGIKAVLNHRRLRHISNIDGQLTGAIGL